MLQLHSETFLEPVEWLGSCHPLVEQLGSASAAGLLGSESAVLRARPVTTPGELREFLHDYQRRLLFPLELPVIRRAWRHAGRNELRELLRFDRELAAEPRLQAFAAASRQAGQTQLRRFRPLHDVRFVRRYLAALERGDAHAWHSVVFGVTMWVFHLPLYQGLLGYARQTTRGFVHAAAPGLRLTEGEAMLLLRELQAALPRRVMAVVRAKAQF